MPRYFLEFAYDGRAYHGWQIQPNAITVQQKIQVALSTICRAETECTGCGRTDTGVHASRFYAHFDSMEVLDESSFLFRMNGLLPHDIKAYSLHRVNADAHARFDAIKRSYSYYISHLRTPFLDSFSWHRYGKPDLDLMNEAASVCIGEHDFACFGKSGGADNGTVCTIYECRWYTFHNGVYFEVSANRFLRGMVRALTGTLLEVSHGLLKPGDMRNLIAQGDRRLAGQSVPAHGLFLEEVVYPYLNAGRRRPFPL